MSAAEGTKTAAVSLIPLFARKVPSAERPARQCAPSRGAPQRHGSMMRSRAPLLLALLAAAAFLRLGGAESDSLPAAVVELVKAGSVSSMQDLQFLLFSESAEAESDNHHDNDTSNRLPRSLLDPQPALQAVCKVRTEVMEVTRSMLDRSNANFLLWPPCVEVQRCSGCCNTKSLQCVPVLTHTRHLQVMKVQYVSKRPLYDKAVVSVLDHVECRCQPASRPAHRRKSLSRQEVRDRSGKSRSKDEIHHRDALKHKQRLSLEDLLSHSWMPTDRLSDLAAPDAVLPPGADVRLHYSPAGWPLNETQYGGVRGRPRYPADERRHRGNVSDVGAESTEELTVLLPNHTEQDEIVTVDSSLSNVTKASESDRFNALFTSHSSTNQRFTNHTSEYKIKPTSKSFKQLSNVTQEPEHNSSQEIKQLQRYKPQTNQDAHKANQSESSQPTNQTNPLDSNSTEQTNQNESLEENNKTSDEEREEAGKEENRINLNPEKKLKEEEMKDLLLLQKRLDEDPHKHHKVQQTHREQDEKLKQLHHTHTHTTTQKTGTVSPPPQGSPPHKPPRPRPQPPKHRRKQRNRISKSAMRALLM